MDTDKRSAVKKRPYTQLLLASANPVYLKRNQTVIGFSKFQSLALAAIRLYAE